MTVVHVVMFEVGRSFALPNSAYAFADKFLQFKPTVEKAQIEEVRSFVSGIVQGEAPKH